MKLNSACFKILSATLAFFLFSFASINALALGSKSVLYINSYHLGYTWSDSIIGGLFSVLRQREDVTIYTEFMDGKRFYGDAHVENFKQMFVSKYKNYTFDVIAVSDNDALEFVLKYYKELFDKIPVVFSGVSNPEDYPLSDKPFYGVVEYISMEQELTTIFSLRPKMKNFYVITDGSHTAKLNRQKMNFLLKKINKRKVNIQVMDVLDRDVLMDQVQKVDPDDAIYVQAMSIDRYGNPLDMKNEGAILCQLASAPTFGNFGNLPKSSATGGMVLLGRYHGTLQGKMVAHLLDKPNEELTPRIVWPDVTFAIDYNQMKRYQIDEDLLTSNIKIYNKPNGLFYKYKNQIFSLLAVYLVLFITIAFLLVTLRLKKKAEIKIKEQYEEILQQNDQIEENNQSLNDSNVELEVMNEQLNQINDELFEAKERAEESDKLKTYFLQNISHEIRTPLNAIIGFAELVTNEDFRSRDKERFYKIIKVNSSHLLNTLTNIIEFSKLQSGMYAVNRTKFSLKDVEQSLTTVFINECSFYGDNKEKNLEFILAFPDHSDHILLNNDFASLQQVFSVLINNAVKFTASGFIEVGFELQGEYGVFHVRDSGKGIKSDKFANIFDSFWKVASLPQGEAYRGIGIGLSIVKRLVELMNGIVWVESQESKGTTVYLSLPVEISTNVTLDTQVGNASDTYNKIFRGKTIVLADDGTANFTYLRILLGKAGAEVVAVKENEDVLTCLKTNKVDVFLLDLSMPTIDGLQASATIKSHNPHIKVIAQTSNAPWDESETYKEYGFDGFVQRPIYKEDLYAVLGKLLT